MKHRLQIISKALSFTFLFGLILFLFLPYIIDQFLVPRLLKNLPFPQKMVSISRLSPWELRGTVLFASSEDPAFSIPKFELHYSPARLLKGRVDTLILDSSALTMEEKDGKIAIKGFQAISNKPEKSDVKKEEMSLDLPIAIDTIIIKNSSIKLFREKQPTLNIVTDSRFSLRYKKGGEKKNRSKMLVALEGKIQIRGDLPLTLNVQAELTKERQGIVLKAELPSLGRLLRLFPAMPDFRAAGNLSAKIAFQLENFTQLQHFSINGEVRDFKSWYKNKPLLENDPNRKNIELKISGNLKENNFDISGIQCRNPAISEIRVSGKMYSNGQYDGEASFLPQMTGSPVAVQFNGLNKNNAGTGETSFHIKTDTFGLNDTVIFAPISLTGQLQHNQDKVTGEIKGQTSSIRAVGSDITLAGISLNIPVDSFSSELNTSTDRTNRKNRTHPNNRTGNLIINEIEYQGHNIGKLTTDFQQTGPGASISSQFAATFGPDLKVFCDGISDSVPTLDIKCRIDKTEFNTETFPPLFGFPPELSATGMFSGKGVFSVENNELSGEASLEVNNTDIQFGEKSLTNINLAVTFPDLPQIRSEPRQLCTIDKLQFGKINLSDGRVTFRIEDGETVFIEKSRFNWCRGKVETGSLTLSPKVESFETTMYCDRLDFAELLSQFGIEDTEGEGSLNGRLPVKLSNNSILFDDGFLFSTPGNSGIVRFNNTGQLRQSMPDISQTAYLDYSMKALENFAYNWTKLSFNSEEKDLLIQMQLDGKPAEPLPFGYKNGQIVPDEKGPGMQHPIRLDANFRLPLQELFRHGKNIQSIMENM